MCFITSSGFSGPKLALPLPADPAIRNAIIKKYFVTEEWEVEYENISGEVKAIADYTGLSFEKVMNLPYSLFLLYRRESWIFNNMRSEPGRKLLKDLIRFQTTKADMHAVRAYKGGAIL